MHTGFVMIPQNIKSPSTALIVDEGKKLPMVIVEGCTSLAKI